MTQERLDIEGVLFVISGSQPVVGMLCQIIFFRQKRSDSAQLQDAFAAIQHCKLIDCGKILAKL